MELQNTVVVTTCGHTVIIHQGGPQYFSEGYCNICKCFQILIHTQSFNVYILKFLIVIACYDHHIKTPNIQSVKNGFKSLFSLLNKVPKLCIIKSIIVCNGYNYGFRLDYKFFKLKVLKQIDCEKYFPMQKCVFIL